MSVALWVSGGIALAVLLAWSSVQLFPEDRIILGTMAYEQVDYEILSHGTNLADIERGRSYYLQLCALCHGLSGQGNGEYSYRMVPKPSSLVDSSVRVQTDDELSAVIRDGSSGTAMQGWGNVLNSTQRKQVVDYIRYLALRNHQ